MKEAQKGVLASLYRGGGRGGKDARTQVNRGPAMLKQRTKRTSGRHYRTIVHITTVVDTGSAWGNVTHHGLQ